MLRCLCCRAGFSLAAEGQAAFCCGVRASHRGASLAAAPGFSSCLPRAQQLCLPRSRAQARRLWLMGFGAPWSADQGSALSPALASGYHWTAMEARSSLLPGSSVVNSEMVPGTVWAIVLLCAEDLAVLKTTTAFSPSIHVST